MREIVLDTETTGFDPASGDRIVEIGCVELVNHTPSGEVYHQYINPERSMPEAAFHVHGLSEEFLSTFPTFGEAAQAFLDFIGDDRLVIHNAAFDMKFLNAELEWMGYPEIPMHRTVDTLTLAREKFPGAQASLDALCRRFDIDNTARTRHGALLDAELLAEVYLELTGGRQPGLLAEEGKGTPGELSVTDPSSVAGSGKTDKPVRPARPHQAHEEELAAHRAFLQDKVTDPIWNR